MTITGTIRKIFDTQKITESFEKRNFALNYYGNVSKNWEGPDTLSMHILDHKVNLARTLHCSDLDTFKEGDEVEVCFNLRGRERTLKDETKYFNTLEVWRITKINKQ